MNTTLILFLAFIAVTLGITAWASRLSGSSASYFAANRRVSAWQNGVAVAGEQDRVLGSGVFGNLTPEDIGPEPGQGRGVGAVKGDCQKRIGHD